MNEQIDLQNSSGDDNRTDFFRKSMESKDAPMESPLYKIRSMREKYKDQLGDLVMFPNNDSTIIFFSKDVEENNSAKFIEDFSRIFMYKGDLVLPKDKVSEFWNRLHAENNTSLENMLNKTEEILVEMKNEETAE